MDKNGAPSYYTAQQIKGWSASYRSDEGGYFPARPMGWQGMALRQRLRYAWLVFTGRCDVLSWDESR